MVSASESLSSGAELIPEVRGVWTTAGLVTGSLFRRQERARTPVKRISVPRAIWNCLVLRQDMKWKGYNILGEHGEVRV